MGGREHKQKTGEQEAGAEKGTQRQLRKGCALSRVGRGAARAQVTSKLSFLNNVHVCACICDSDWLCSPGQPRIQNPPASAS